MTTVSEIEFVESDDYQAFVHQRLKDPYPLYDWLRAEHAVHWCEPLKCWLVTRYANVFDLLKDSRLSTSRGGLYLDALTPDNRELAGPLVEHINTWMLPMDEPRHTRCRRLVSLAFTPRTVERLRPMIERATSELIARALAQGEFDFMRDFSEELPATVICEMLGVPRADRDGFQESACAITRFSAAAGPELNKTLAAASDGLKQLTELFDPLIDDRRSAPRDDLISAMLKVEDDGDRLSREELFAMCIFLFIAGQDTTMSLLGNGMWLLLRNPDEMAKLKADTDRLIGTAIEESLRYESPVPRGVRRATEDFVFCGQPIEKDQTVILLLGAAHRDPDQFPDPNRFDVARSPNKHVAFGLGPHFCIGAPLARLEAQIAFPEILRRLPGIRLLADEPDWTSYMGLRALRTMPVCVK